MRRIWALWIGIGVAIGLGIGPAYGWGDLGHRLITRAAARAMPEPLSAFFRAYADSLAERSLDPDRWRKMEDPQYQGEGANHFIDLDYEAFGRFPFPELPRDRKAAYEKFGAATFEQYGKLPWRIAEYLEEVVAAMESGDPERIVATAGAFAHYVEDAHMPLHCTINYDGQYTGQRGVHGLWEIYLVERYAQELEAAVVADPGALTPLEDPAAAAWEIVLDSYAEHFDLLNADRRARAGLSEPLRENELYFQRLWDYSGALCRQQMSAAATMVARYWLTAWERAGRPPLPTPETSTKAPVRARDLGIRIGTLPTGRWNAITDVEGVRVGHVTLIQGEGADAIRTGITAIVPREDIWHHKVPAATYTFNGNGEVTGAHWINEAGRLEVPILLTGTLNIPRVADGVIEWMRRVHPEMGLRDDVVLPVVAECSDAWLSNAPLRPITAELVIQAIESAASGPVPEGAVGAGTGMVSYSFKGGIGTASRVVDGYTVGVLVLANGGRRPELRVDGVPVGRLLTEKWPEVPASDGSFILVIATDAPLTSRQLQRICKRAFVGLARTGTVGRHGSGDFAIAFSTALEIPHFPEDPKVSLTILEDSKLNGLFTATMEATEEAVLNALVAAEDMVGRNGVRVYAIPHDRLRAILYQHGRLFGATPSSSAE
ncbi:MAG: hypothetical protein KatS3mg115_0362 [Candidatus Poribacteria bacterium]|nr:MAG: hypothetical protein KatS3mg115_0362 [Candidatus Poribacteria bacterium]